ncbi:hypothetical protein M422DRAFT_272995 [Sphaerobolus stellatus SS14]|uniref:Unplaced genomic scaffold SPHSTscaffold_314, whole genome shotgun sequence n=1 Tax=Sphaerobolus stellatus (strain SS14) TaxID=990650 RepID=A0A0C9TAA2_SPHS4|nr:hypothetical protein M422DRAFT_272995 [Sphaerobolus stellatus SS14]
MLHIKHLAKPRLSPRKHPLLLVVMVETLSGVPSVSEDAYASQPNLPGHYASLDPSKGAEDTPTGTPNPSGGGGPGSGPPGGGPPAPGGSPPGGGPPDGGPDPNPNPGPNSNPDGGDGGGPPDDDGDPSSDDAEDEALNRSHKDNLAGRPLTLAIIAKHVVDKDGGNIKVRVPDTFNGSDPDKLQAFRSEANQVTFAISYLCGTLLDHFEPYILGEIPEVQMMTSWALLQAFLTESFGVLYPEEEAKEQLDLVIFPEDGKASTFFASFEKWKTRTNFGDRSY